MAMAKEPLGDGSNHGTEKREPRSDRHAIVNPAAPRGGRDLSLVPPTSLKRGSGLLEEPATWIHLGDHQGMAVAGQQAQEQEPRRKCRL